MCFCLLPVTGLKFEFSLRRQDLALCFWTFLAVFGQFYTKKSFVVVVMSM